MVNQRDNRGQADGFSTGLPLADSRDEIPRWLAVVGLAAGFTLFIALLRYAIDLLGVVFVIILVGFAIRALSDWLTEGESVSGWALSALSLGLVGTALVAIWLFNSGSLETAGLQSKLPGPIQRTVAWLEAQGWGQRVLLPSATSTTVLAGGEGRLFDRPAASARPAPAERAAPVMAQPRMPTLPPASGSPAPRRRAAAPPSVPSDEAEAAPRIAEPTAAPTPPVARVAPSVDLSVSPTRAVVGHAVRLTATVRGADGPAPSGTVTFLVDGSVIGRASLRGGTALLVTLDFTIGEHTLVASYSGDARHLDARSSPTAVAVTRR